MALTALWLAWPASNHRYAILTAAFLVLALAGRWLGRYLIVARVCLVIGLNLLSTHLQSRGRGERAVAAFWELCHRINARYIYDEVLSLGGFWVKVAQGVSVISALPDAYGEELSQLQDAMPPDPMAHVHSTLRAELGSNWAQTVTYIDPTPLGSATIAQVHKCKLRLPASEAGDAGHRVPSSGPNGSSSSLREVDAVIKVQHPRVVERLAVDIHASRAVAALLGMAAPHLFKDLGPIVKDIASLTRSELDFTREAASQALAQEALEASGLHACVPRVYPSVVRAKVLGMEYIDGIKLTEMRTSGRYSEEQVRQATETLVRYYGRTMHSPIFNVDPHPGNLLVEGGGRGRLVVLDWGQARRLTISERVAHAQLFLAILMEDGNLLEEACAGLGAPFEDLAVAPNATPATMIGAMRFLLRDTKASKMATKADFKALEATLSGLSDQVKSIQGGGSELFKGPLMPFSKTVALLFEVCTINSVSLPLLPLLCAEGYPVLLAANGFGHVPVHPTPTLPCSFVLGLPPPSAPSVVSTGADRPASGQSSLQPAMEALLSSLHSEGLLLGAQLSVLDLATGQQVADVAIGHCSWREPRNVVPATKFNLCELSKLFVAASILRLVDAGLLGLHQTVGTHDTTLEQALSHTAGRLEFLDTAIGSFEDMCDVDAMAKVAASATPLIEPGVRQQYHHTSYGWLLAHACTLGGCDLRRAWNAMAEAALGPGGAQSLSLHAPMNGEAVTAGGAAALSSKNMVLPPVETLLEEFAHFSHTVSRGAADDANPSEVCDGAALLSLFGKLHWLEPSAFASPRARAAIIPGLQAYANARTTAEALRGIARGAVIAPSTLTDALRSRKPSPSPMATPCQMPRGLRTFNQAEWGLGVQLLSPEARDSSSGAQWGHLGANGSFALVLRGRRRKLVAVLLLNRAGGEEAAKRVRVALEAFAGGGES